MAKSTPLSDDELIAAISSAEQMALGTVEGQITADRADAIDRYYGKPYTGDGTLASGGRSTVISRDVADVVEGVVSNVVKPFVGGDQIVVFDPMNEADEKAAEQETDYVNFIAMQRNNGFVWLVSAIKDALLLRAGYVKCNWHVRQDIVTEDYYGLSDEELGMLLQGGELEVAQHSEYPDPSYMPQAGPDGQPLPGPMLHDVKVKRTKPTEYVEILPCPPDEVLVSERARGPSLQDVDFVQHRTHKTISQLREAGYTIDDEISDDDRGDTIEDMARMRFRQAGDVEMDETGDPARRLVLYKETYLRLDRNGDGKAELIRVCTVGVNILHEEEADIIPIACFSGVLVPHQHLGMSVYDLVEDLAEIKTNLMRSYLDNRNLQNNARSAIDVDRVNIDDFLVSRPGGVVRVVGDPGTAIFPIVTPDTSAGALQGLEYLDTVRESRTGYTRNSAGMDNDALTNTTATGMSMQLSQSQLRLEMIARTIAETGVRDTFRIIHALTLKHSSRADEVRLNGTWAKVDPKMWGRRSDLSITIGLGTGTADQQLAKLMALGPIMQQGQMMGLVGVEQAYNYASEAFKLSGYKSTERFVKAPEIDPQTGKPKEPPPPPPPPPVQVAQIQQQGKQAELQATMQADVQKFHAQQQSDAQKAAADAALKQQQLQIEAAAKHQEQQNAMAIQASNDARDNQKAELEHQREMQRMAMEDAFKRDQMLMQAQLKREEIAANVHSATVASGGGEESKQMAQMVKEMHANSSAPAEFQRGPDGRIAQIKRGGKVMTVKRGPDGSMMGIH